MKKVDNIVLNIPHSSLKIPNINDFFRWNGDIKGEMLNLTDLYTDKIFNPNINNVSSIVFEYNRFFCDAERLENDGMESIGQGIYYTEFNGLKRTFNQEEYDFVINARKNHIKRLQEKIVSESTLLIDCHSFSEDLSDIDICIGYNEDWSKPTEEMLDIVKDHFKNLKIGINEPFSNSITPAKDFKYKSFMIEVNKRLYIKDGKLKTDWYKFNMFINSLYKKLIL